ncbi:MAG: glycosyltransferase [Parcubacteria group bacterium Gr01-1014_70]|nr:MAG: glycosyltransferase [Parcubacteria group bacterium Gr01-1014_70]
MIRVLYITRAKLSLSRAHTRNIIKTAEYLSQEEGVHVTLFSSAAESRTGEELRNMNGVIYPFELLLAPFGRSLFAALFRFQKSFDVLYFRDPVLWHIALIARFLFGKKIVFEAHGSHEWRFMKPLWLLSFYVSHGVVYITEKLRIWYDPRNKKKSAVVHANAPDFELFLEKDKTRLSLRQHLRISPDAFLLVYAGSGMWYDVKFLIHLLPLLPPSCTLLLVGLKDAEKEALRAVAASIWVEERVFLILRVSRREFPQYLLMADVLLIPPTLTFPGSICSKLYEYLAAGVPIVAHKAGANDEVLRHGKNAFVIENPTPDDYVGYISQVMHNKELAASLGREAIADARQYTWEARAERIGSLLKRIMV